MNPYAELEVPANADAETIKRAYRRKAHKTHPDRKDGDTKKFQIVQKAYEVLSNPDRREKFDRTGDTEAAKDPRAVILEQVASLLLTLIDRVDVEHNDLIALARNDMEGGLRNIAEQIAQQERKIAKRESALKRLRRKKNGSEIVADMVRGDIKQQTQALANMRGRSEEVRKMLEVLNDYEYAADAQMMGGWQLFQMST